MKDKLLELFPEIGEINDAEIKDKTLDTLIDAIRIGGWTLEDLDQVPFTLLIKGTKVSYRQHTRAVTQMALACGKIMDQNYRDSFRINFDHLISGAILHDVGKLLEFGKNDAGFVKTHSGKLLRHPFSGAGLCVKHGLPDKVVHIVAVHAKEGEGGYRCPEAVAVHHVDFVNFEPLRDL
ncbi:MAG: HDIG domain-containing protein [bacterium]|nr:HDIG domain-containing protein [bacterium]